MSQLLFYTNEVFQKNEEILKIFYKRMEQTADFYTDIKPFVEQTDELVKKWKKEAVEWVRAEKPRFIHIIQIEQAYENLQRNALECFMPHTKVRRFLETHRAIAYVLNNIIDEVN
ncbi:YppE family protein [Ectobacillus sp. JY-23]|uniref:DUF1798 family protein n=1 Tax=Ectobacillus sp. JY-23 TaxID=2933872 RepID=UPI001FF5FBC3|nr:DUF1798 family protein [Ectobacillus sp. JY-23]UOY93432.1 YppE family protein [Ectobacillus sp. JY-23]